MAKLLTFNYTIYAEPQRAGLDVVLGIVSFRVQGQGENPTDRGLDFWRALKDFKDAVSPRRRTWDDEKKLWTVLVTPSVKRTLVGVFSNAAWLFEVAERQLPLF